MQPFIGYAPDADPSTPGVIVDCQMMEPSRRGMRSAPSAAAPVLPALSARCVGAALVTKLDGTRRLFAGTQTAIYEAAPSGWSNVSEAPYTGSADVRWVFRQFGDVSIATNGMDDPQASTSGAFETLSGAPKAKLMEVVEGFVVMANITGSAYPHADGWWCSALYDHTNWTPAIATQAARARLLDSPGPITALKKVGSLLVAFKARAMHVGQYVGPDVIWAWSQIPGDIGSASNEGVVSDGSALYFWGGDDFYRFDGTRPVPIGEPVRNWFAETADEKQLHTMIGDYDRVRGLIRWYFQAQDGSRLCLVLNTRTGRWGRADRAIEAVVDFVSTGATYNDPDILAGVTYDDVAWTQSYDSPFWTAGAVSASIVDTTHTLRALSGVSGASSITTGDFGDDDRYTLLSRVRPRYSQSPAGAQMTNFHKAGAGDALQQDQTVPADDGKFDVLQSARWHRLRFDWQGDVEVSGFRATLAPEGDR